MSAFGIGLVIEARSGPTRYSRYGENPAKYEKIA